MRPRTPSAKLVGIEIQGGLGNQLFQYAAAYSLARHHEAELRLNTDFYGHTDFRELALDRFGITWTECRHPCRRGVLRAIARRFGADRDNPFRHGIFQETRHSFMPEVERAPLPVFLIGYFQSARYFSGYETDIRGLFDTARFASPATTAIEVAIRSAANPVMVHVRRGDYASDPETLARYGLLDRAYYESARRAIETRTGPASYFVFSDDAVAARALFEHWPDVTFVSGLSALEDLMLMTRCRHAIIANSTFSWWGAWLGQTSGNTVVAPAAWVLPASRDAMPTHDLCPPDWLLL